ncbi:predicted protein [Histoplasma capsulatum H143]|uniref:Uncharacterized protein n=1 Tax=Ajellomyces capsulatus (strain H143) TaxID=544712 RepID=C6H975_AJECH|nr:predicted protein [Histoplasma capsulatum H143]
MVNPLGGECSMESKAGFLIVDSALEEAEDHSSSHYSHQMQLEAATRGRRHGLRTWPNEGRRKGKLGFGPGYNSKSSRGLNVLARASRGSFDKPMVPESRHRKQSSGVGSWEGMKASKW